MAYNDVPPFVKRLILSAVCLALIFVVAYMMYKGDTISLNTRNIVYISSVAGAVWYNLYASLK
jgi:hypothetical protein